MNQHIVKPWKKKEFQQFETQGSRTNKWYNIHVYPSAEGISVYWEDITEHKQAEDALKESETRFRSLYENSIDAIVLATPEGNILAANHAAEEMFLMSEKEIIKAGRKGLFIMDKRAELAIKKRTEKGRARAELTYKKGDGSTFTGETASNIFTDADGSRRTSIIIRDLTKRKQMEDELKESEDKFRSLYNSMAEGVAIHKVLYGSSHEAVDYVITDANPAYENITGLKRNKVVGKKASEIYGIDKPPYMDIYAQVAEGGESTQFETYFEPMNKHFRIAVTSPKKGNFATFFEDITRHKQIEEELRQSRDNLELKVQERTVELDMLIDELKRSNEELQRFAYVASHDLQEPLRTIAMFTNLLETRYKGKFDKDADEFMDYIIDAAKRMKQLIDDLLEYSRVTTEEKEFEPVNMEEVLDNALINLKISIEENNAEITHDKLPAITADKTQLIQLFQNIIGNAIKFKKEDKPPKIHISAKKECNECVFSVKDNGIGMDPQYAKDIFEIFRRLHTRNKYQGTGVGLSITKKIVERHGGRIWVESELGKGSTFYFTLSKP